MNEKDLLRSIPATGVADTLGISRASARTRPGHDFSLA
jgi:hypothetical protein